MYENFKVITKMLTNQLIYFLVKFNNSYHPTEVAIKIKKKV